MGDVKDKASKRKMDKKKAAKDKRAKLEKEMMQKKKTAADAAKEARGKADKTQKTLDMKMKEYNETKKAVDDYNNQEDKRKTMNCGGRFADCSKTWCCALGCQCEGENQWYAQCTGIEGKGWCDKEGAIKSHNQAVAKYKTQDKEKKELDEKFAD